MKKYLIAVLALALILCGCGGCYKNKDEDQKLKVKSQIQSGVWISYSEINSILSDKTSFKNQFEKVINNCLELDISNVYIHIRPFCDCLFESKYFPMNAAAKGFDFDVFEYMISEFHKVGIKVHAWINPYRVSNNGEDINSLPQESPARLWLTDEDLENDRNVCFAGGIYLNPAESEVRALVINGIREILFKYEVDGIHFDDYFYPTISAEFDLASYEKYKQTSPKPLSLDAWRRANVNALISGCYTAIKFIDKDILFSISPAASIDKNYSELYADVELWVKSGCVDYIIPQLYFGFEYPDPKYSFKNLLEDWKKLAQKNEKVGLMIGLATYKIKTDLEPDKEEWTKNEDIIARQVDICKTDNRVEGYVFFSYTSMCENIGFIK